MKVGYDPIGKKETVLGELKIQFITDAELPNNETLDEYCDYVEEASGKIEELIRVFLILKNDIRIKTE